MIALAFKPTSEMSTRELLARFRPTDVVYPENLATMCGVSAPTVYRRIAAGEIHVYRWTRSGPLLLVSHLMEML